MNRKTQSQEKAICPA